MKIYKTDSGILIETQGNLYNCAHHSLDLLVNQDDLQASLQSEIKKGKILGPAKLLEEIPVRLPLQSQEIWAAGVTYTRSRDARMEESKDAGGGSFYDKVYDAERPELFFKASPHRCVGPGEKLRIRKDSSWNVPEPELTLLINNRGKIVGYTIGNDMSSRSIEGENPLYLPQAKTYDGSAAIGPCLYIPESPLAPETKIQMQIKRSGNVLFADENPISKMKRSFAELVGFLYRECSFPQGCFLMTGTCLVPPPDFTLQRGDEISIRIDPIGILQNTIE